MRDNVIMLVVLGSSVFAAYLAWNYANDGVGAKAFRAAMALIFAFGIIGGVAGNFMTKRTGGVEYPAGNRPDPCDGQKYC